MYEIVIKKSKYDLITYVIPDISILHVNIEFCIIINLQIQHKPYTHNLLFKVCHYGYRKAIIPV